MVSLDDIEKRLIAALPGAHVSVKDLTGGGDHLQVDVVWAGFANLTQVKRHRMVYAPLKDILGGALHALALTTHTPDEV